MQKTQSKYIPLIAILCLIAVVLTFTFSGCSGKVDYTVPETKDFTAEDMATELSDFLKDNPNRTSLTSTQEDERGEADGEKKAALWLQSRLESYVGDRATVTLSSATHNTTYSDKFPTQNVIVHIDAPEENNPDDDLVVIGTYYDNAYETVTMSQYKDYVYLEGTKAEGAMANGTGVATVVALAKYFSEESVKSTLTVDIDLVFYGLGCISNFGINNYLNNYLGDNKDNIILAITIEKLGGDNLLMYTDEVSTAHGNFIKKNISDNGYGDYVKERSALTADIDYQVSDDLVYTPYDLLSSSSAYIGNYNVFNLSSGADNSFYLYERESDNRGNVAGTSMDTLSNLESNTPDYAEQMAVAAQVVANVVCADGFKEACLESKNSIGGYAWLNIPLVAYITVAVLSLGLFGLVLFLTAKSEKKNRANLNKKVKVAVFGMDYENPQNDDIFIDIKTQGGDSIQNPFDIDPFEDMGEDNDKQSSDNKNDITENKENNNSQNGEFKEHKEEKNDANSDSLNPFDNSNNNEAANDAINSNELSGKDDKREDSAEDINSSDDSDKKDS